ncbi:MAG: hypothetical protein JXR69_05385, partial [Candidatus Delongbacteria bacterium]|nr:hypothetical protein [Candidatus Delongbacteria bacterium]
DNIFKQDAIRRGDEWESSPTVSNNTQYFQNRLKQVNKRHGLGEMIRSFKSNVSREIKQIKYKSTFKWQRSFHDHIIRNEKELYSIRKYIRDNPLDW